jgi:transposase-like protein
MKRRLALLLAPLVLLAGFAIAQAPTEKASQRPADTAPAKAGGTDAQVIKFQRPSYPLDTCPISGEKLGSMAGQVDIVVDGQLVRLCCGGCKKGVEKDKVAILKKIQDAVIAQQSIGYPMERCPISGEKMENPVNHVVGTRLVRFCCNDCVKSFDTDPAKQTAAMAKLDNAWMHSQKAKYTVTTCPVSGETLDADGKKAIDYMYGTTLVRLCCKGCVKEIEKDPDVVLAKLATLKKAAPAAAPKGERESGDKKGS